MILKTLKRDFTEALLEIYPTTEIESFFNLLAEHFLNMKRLDVALNMFVVVSGKKHEKFNDAILRLKNYEPIQYIVKETEFYGLPFSVDKNVLIPRPETEELVAWIINDFKDQHDLKILDVGTGSGCIAIAIAKHLPHAEVFALDVSWEALKTAKKNAALNLVDIHFIESDILEIENSNLLDDICFDIIVSNPPYVRTLEKAHMQTNVLNYEPHLALFVDDEDPLCFYKAISKFAVNNLAHRGVLFFEINEYLGGQMKELLHKFQWNNIQLKKDIFNKDRMIKATKSI